jgi:hypothetical protein
MLLIASAVLDRRLVLVSAGKFDPPHEGRPLRWRRGTQVEVSAISAVPVPSGSGFRALQ